LALLDIAIDDQTDVHAWGETLRMADIFKLTVYDAAYLELAPAAQPSACHTGR
jgi:predicted nucleic acid-binding protein